MLAGPVLIAFELGLAGRREFEIGPNRRDKAQCLFEIPCLVSQTHGPDRLLDGGVVLAPFVVDLLIEIGDGFIERVRRFGNIERGRCLDKPVLVEQSSCLCDSGLDRGPFFFPFCGQGPGLGVGRIFGRGLANERYALVKLALADHFFRPDHFLGRRLLFRGSGVCIRGFCLGRLYVEGRHRDRECRGSLAEQYAVLVLCLDRQFGRSDLVT